ncbi:nicotinamide riboside transporter PnuC [Pasteurella atlantica]|uniref:nicotinamide riboside transporter PnuC n=1 Tax=Pasteurellaceae TaxID=712 RepID=UPI0027503D63|nr:nicotinamide riboside transporter PnuC [Pasteurella atlantica]MDP8099015.1 nicotinamide riboside transporter PnuC [Pasteurella atlantica]MDP8107042.1 nicotinamide riboside transporter PnuC [Pasteurella atlantica]MDP8116732.1 nicotinamide riboside transporter PnuC [Pasteurella atlantica]
MNYKQLIEQTKHELFSGWKPFEVIWLGLFLLAQIIAFILQPDTLLGMIAGISGIICVVFVGKGKISNYFFGLIFAYSYFYVSLGNNYLGEMNTTLYVYIPAQFIGYFLWKENMQNNQGGDETVIAKALDLKGWTILITSVAVGSLCFISALKYFGGSAAGLDGVTTILVVAAQLLMVLRYREQWALWIIINILSIILWVDTAAMYLMYGAYLLNSLYGYYNWTKLQKN